MAKLWFVSAMLKSTGGNQTYGKGDATYLAAGGETAIRTLVDHFYDIMAVQAPDIFSWHPPDQATTRDKLARFLCGWMGGPRLYQQKYGPISIPDVHRHLAVDTEARDAWLACMSGALARMDYPAELRAYLLAQLAIPAERIRQGVQARP